MECLPPEHESFLNSGCAKMHSKNNDNKNKLIMIETTQPGKLTRPGTKPGSAEMRGMHFASIDLRDNKKKFFYKKPFRHFTYVTTHSPTLPSLYLRHSSFSNTCFASPASQALHLIHLASLPCELISVLQGCQYGTSTKMDALIVYDAFQTFGIM